MFARKKLGDGDTSTADPDPSNGSAAVRRRLSASSPEPAAPKSPPAPAPTDGEVSSTAEPLFSATATAVGVSAEARPGAAAAATARAAAAAPTPGDTQARRSDWIGAETIELAPIASILHELLTLDFVRARQQPVALSPEQQQAVDWASSVPVIRQVFAQFADNPMQADEPGIATTLLSMLGEQLPESSMAIFRQCLLRTIRFVSREKFGGIREMFVNMSRRGRVEERTLLTHVLLFRGYRHAGPNVFMNAFNRLQSSPRLAPPPHGLYDSRQASPYLEAVWRAAGLKSSPCSSPLEIKGSYEACAALLKAGLPPQEAPLKPQRTSGRPRIAFLSGSLQSVVGKFAGWLHELKAFVDVDMIRYDSSFPDCLTRGNCTWLCQDDNQAAAYLRSQAYDAIVDLEGHSGNGRQKVFAQKIAPVRITYLGYPATTGLSSEADARVFRLVDEHTDPTGVAEPFASEELLRIGQGMWCYRPLVPTAPPNPTPPCLRRANAPIQFGFYGNPDKLNPHTARLWKQILDAVPDSTLVLRYCHFDQPKVREVAINFFRGVGIHQSRLQFLCATGEQEVLEQFDRIDIALDSFPYNNTTIAVEGMLRGVPEVTRVLDDRHCSRVGLSLSTQVGLADLVARSDEDYVRIAVTLANDRERLQELRTELPKRSQAAFCDEKDFARRFFEAIRPILTSG